MSIRLVVTRGFGNGTFSGTIKDVARRGYGAAVQVAVPTDPSPRMPPIGSGARHFTPGALSGRKKRRIDEVISKETRLVKQFATYQENGADADLINGLLLAIREVQLLILRLALESEAAERYIALKRDEEEIEDIKFILTVI